MSDSNEEDRAFFDVPNWLAERMLRNAHLYNKAGRLAAMADKVKNDESGLVGEIPPLKILLLPHEADYVARLVASDLQRMTENRDHGVSHGMRGYAPPDFQVAESVRHSVDMARTAATIEAMEALEEQRQDTAILAGDQDNQAPGSPA